MYYLMKIKNYVAIKYRKIIIKAFYTVNSPSDWILFSNVIDEIEEIVSKCNQLQNSSIILALSI